MTQDDQDVTIRDLLRGRGVSQDDIDKATQEGTLLWLTVERLIYDEPKYDIEQMLAGSPLEPERTTELWRSLGFPDPPDGEPFFTDADVEVLGVLSSLFDTGDSDPELLMGMTRVAGQSMARFAAAQIELYVERAKELAEEVPDVDLLDQPNGAQSIVGSLPITPRLMEYVWRRHMQAAVRNRLMRNDWAAGSEPQAIGFADLVGFTALSQQISTHELAEVIARFERLAYDTVAALGGRVVKMIGDEVMFTVSDARQAVEIALELSAAYGDDDSLSGVRVGLSWGSVLAREGDCFGPVVNRASRIVNIAYPGTVVVSDELHELLEGDEALEWKSLRRKNLKGIGKITLWSVWRADEVVPDKSRRDRARNARSERIDRAVDELAEAPASSSERRARRDREKAIEREKKAERDKATEHAKREAREVAEREKREAREVAEREKREARETAEREKREAREQAERKKRAALDQADRAQQAVRESAEPKADRLARVHRKDPGNS